MLLLILVGIFSFISGGIVIAFVIAGIIKYAVNHEMLEYRRIRKDENIKYKFKNNLLNGNNFFL